MNVLIIEDELGIQKQLKWGLPLYSLTFTNNKAEAIKAFMSQDFPVVLLDLGLPPDPDNASEGLAILSILLSTKPNTKIIIFTGSNQKEHALKAVELGAYGFLQKDIGMNELAFNLNAAFTMYELEAENRTLRYQLEGNSKILGNSHTITKTIIQLNKVAKTKVTTLLLGESGTGKELFANSLHELSERQGEFIAINCASIPDALLESELFGHERGAFTGAHKNKKGKIELADRGTLFLDEIGDMPLDLQSKLLRFLQERVIERVGGTKKIPVDVRIVCATHRDLNKMTKEETFRSDLYYRLSEFPLNIPALRERDSDVILLANSFLASYKNELHSNVKGFCADAVFAILHYTWPGNIRELQNKIKTALILTENEMISVKDLQLTNENLFIEKNKKIIPFTQLTLMEERRLRETQMLKVAHKKCQGNVKAISKQLGIARSTYYSLVERYELNKELTSP